MNTIYIKDLVKKRFNNILSGCDERFYKILKNIVLTFCIKVASLLISFMQIPMLINHISPAQYGIYITISSFMTWITFMDIGMGNGTRNKITEAVALEKYDEAKMYISTTYALLSIIAMTIFIGFVIINQFLDWTIILNIKQINRNELNKIITITVGIFSAQFIVQFINTILIATHRVAMSSVITLISQVIALLLIIFFKYLKINSLIMIMSCVLIVPVIIMYIATIILFKVKLKKIKPSLKLINWKYKNEMFKSGSTFLVIQLGTLILFQTNNFVVSYLFGPEVVAEYNIANKLFSVVIVIFSIIITPYWAAANEAYIKSDLSWLKRNIQFVRLIWLIISIIVIPIIILYSDSLYKIWIGNSVHINLTTTIALAIYTICYMAFNINCYFLNGIGKVKIQSYLYVIVCILSVPLTVIIGEQKGFQWIINIKTTFIFIMCLILGYQINKIIKNDAKGFWSK